MYCCTIDLLDLVSVTARRRPGSVAFQDLKANLPDGSSPKGEPESASQPSWRNMATGYSVEQKLLFQPSPAVSGRPGESCPELMND